MRLESVELEAVGQEPPILSQPHEKVTISRRLCDFEGAGAGNRDFYGITFMQTECIDHALRQPNGKTVATRMQVTL